MEYPSAPRSLAIDDFVSLKSGAVQIPNPYNWLEDFTSTQSQAFVQAQNSQFRSFIQDPDLDLSQDVLQRSLLQLHNLPSLAGVPQPCGGYYYFRVAGQGAVFPVTYRVQKPLLANVADGTGLLQLSEKFHDEAEDGGALVSSGFSKSGKYWAYSSSIRGSAWVNIRIKDTVTKQVSLEVLGDTKFTAKEASISWFRDLGFFYQFWPGKETKGGPQLRFHRVGSEQKDDVVVFKDENNSDHTFAAEVTENHDFLLLSVFKGGRSNKLWAAKITPEHFSASSGLKLDFDFEISDKFEAEWSYMGKSRTSLIFHNTANNGQVVAFSTIDHKIGQLIAGTLEKTLKFAKMLPSGDFLVVYSVHVHDELYIFSSTGEQRSRIESSILTIVGISIDPGTSSFFALESTFHSPPRLWRGTENAESATLVHIPLTPGSSNGTSTFSTRQIFYSSNDGTKIPMFITSSGTITPQTPILLYIYGGLGISVIPHFRADFVTYLRAFNGVLAIANVRGGGEYGERWYAAACKTLRQNLFDDVISGVKYLRSAFGSSSIALMGESMGGLNAASVMIQQPSLLQGVFLNVAVIDILRRARLSGGARGQDDLGDPEVPEEFDFMASYAPLENVSIGEKYPSVLLMAGDKDDIVPAWHSCKMAAALQYATRDGEGAKIVSLSVLKDAGHGMNNSAEQKAKASLEKWLWAVKPLGWKVVSQQV
ncbi:alpha/beta-hydrolase [Stipitochalara longipes BDJ]|nr:alpha/beta-hydrolase [Stipitochalara longipes BDJ]